MSAHLISDPASTTTATPESLSPAWTSLSAALTDEVSVIADREDLIVNIAPGAGHGAPACFLPHHATIEVNGTHLNPLDPATLNPADFSDRFRYPTVWGLLVHECAHARHSMWQVPEGAAAGAAESALLLEESRIEGAHIRRRPDDRLWLRAAATHMILDDFGPSIGMGKREAAHAAGLLLARADAGILTRHETTDVEREVSTILGTDTLASLRALWQQAHTVPDDDAETMLDLGRRWCEAIGTDPEAEVPATSNTEATNGTPSPLATAVSNTVAKIAKAATNAPRPLDPAREAEAGQRRERAAQRTASKVAHEVFNTSGPQSTATPLGATRLPNHAERTAARTLARALTTAGVRERTATKTTSATPPGRLRMRGALAADAQRAAGQVPTAEPFTRITRRIASAPPLRVGIACDVSGSMSAYAEAVASTAWILAHAMHHTPVPGESATAIFGKQVRPITHPGTAPAVVTEFETRDLWEDIPGAINALDGALGLAHPGAARLLVVISDGRFRKEPRKQGQKLLNRLRAHGCGVLWLAASEQDTPLDGATVHVLTDPTRTAKLVGRAATSALRAAR